MNADPLIGNINAMLKDHHARSGRLDSDGPDLSFPTINVGRYASSPGVFGKLYLCNISAHREF